MNFFVKSSFVKFKADLLCSLLAIGVLDKIVQKPTRLLKTDLSENKLDHLDFQVFDYFETEMVMSRVKISSKELQIATTSSNSYSFLCSYLLTRVVHGLSR